jgi:hypothetical protein
MKPFPVVLPTVWRGCVYQPVFFNWKDHDGHPADIGGFTPMASARDFVFDLTITNYSLGIVRMNLHISQTPGKLKLGVREWDWIWINNVTGVVSPPLLCGTVEVKDPETDTEFDT